MPRHARHSFAPLLESTGQGASNDLMQLKGIVFDMDGTLCMFQLPFHYQSSGHDPYSQTNANHTKLKGEPQNHMFAEMRAAVNIPKEIDILDYIHSLPDAEQAEAFGKVQEIERRAMESQTPQAGLVSLMQYLDRNGIKRGICTRNFE